MLALAEALSLNSAQRDALLAAARQPPSWFIVEPDSSLVTPPTPLIGRSMELAGASALLRERDTRLVTLTGPPGVGKTRLALETCAALRGDYDAIFSVALSPLADERLIGAVICQALGLRDQSRRRSVDTISDFCQGRRLLVMLDNFEHLLGAAPVLSELLFRCRALRMLVTSRASLRIRGEHELPVEPLPLPEAGADGHVAVAAMERVPSVALFLERVRGVAPDFEMTPVNAPAIASICRKLDGLPLALELAAPWIKLLTAQGLLDQLHRQWALQMEGSRDLPERQRTMTATLAWSYRLLRAEEKALFRRLSVFAGGATLDAVETVCQAAGTVPGGVMRPLVTLATHHLVRRQNGAAEQQRVSMLGTVRDYAATLLDEEGEAAATARAYARYYADLVARAEPALLGPDQVSYLQRLDAELDNIRAVLGWAESSGAVELGLQTAARMALFWEIRGRAREGLAWLERLSARAGEPSPGLRAQARNAAGLLAARLGDLELASRRLAESLATCRRLDDRRGIAAALNGMGLLSLWRGDPHQGRALLEEAIAIRRDVGDRYGTAVSLNVLGAIVSELGDEALALRSYEESLAIFRLMGNRIGVSRCLLNLGVSARRMGDLEQSERSLEEAVALARGLDAPELLGAALVNLGNVPRTRGDVMAAHDLYGEALRTFVQIGDQRWIAYTLECLAWLAWSQGELYLAARVYGAAAARRRQFGVPGWPVTSSEHVQATGALRTMLGEARFAADSEAGARLSLDQVAAEAI